MYNQQIVANKNADRATDEDLEMSVGKVSSDLGSMGSHLVQANPSILPKK